MTPLVQQITDIASFSTLILDALAVGLLFILATPLRKHGAGKKIIEFFGERAILFSFVVAFVATAGSLFYSEIAGFQPCLLCWWQRIFLYPQVILLFVALIKKDRGVRVYTLILSGIGTLIALYHTYIQFGGESVLPCAAQGAVSCQLLYFLEYGYVTIPTMSLTVFVLMLIFMLAPDPKKR